MTVWDKFSGFYDITEIVYNRKVFLGIGKVCAEYIEKNDRVLECACGTGSISVFIAPECRELTATDLSAGMLKQAEKKLKRFDNVRLRHADVTHLKCPDNSFDKVIAGNVIHLLDEPGKALSELLRVCKPGGKILLPTYISGEKKSSLAAISLLRRFGVDFKETFKVETYRRFLEDLGHPASEIRVIEGRMPNAIAVIEKAE